MAAKEARGIDGRHLLRGSASMGLALFLVAIVSMARELHPNDPDGKKQ